MGMYIHCQTQCHILIDYCGSRFLFVFVGFVAFCDLIVFSDLFVIGVFVCCVFFVFLFLVCCFIVVFVCLF